MKYDEKVHHTLWALSFFSSLSFYHGLDMFLATRDALVINGSYPGFFTSSGDMFRFDFSDRSLNQCVKG